MPESVSTVPLNYPQVMPPLSIPLETGQKEKKQCLSRPQRQLHGVQILKSSALELSLSLSLYHSAFLNTLPLVFLAFPIREQAIKSVADRSAACPQAAEQPLREALHQLQRHRCICQSQHWQLGGASKPQTATYANRRSSLICSLRLQSRWPAALPRGRAQPLWGGGSPRRGDSPGWSTQSLSSG